MFHAYSLLMPRTMLALLGLIFSFLVVACGPQGIDDSRLSTLDDSNLGHFGQIVGGTEVLSKSPESAYVAMIYGEDSEGTPFICTGTFISNSVILTAGHCVVEDLRLLTLSFSVSPFNDSQIVNLPVQSVVRHEKYRKENDTPSQRNDVALIRFTGGLPPRAKIAALPAVANGQAFPISNLLALGYGRTEGREDSENASAEIGILRSVRISLDTRADNFAASNNNFIADQRNKKGVCSGDSGGPLVDTRNKKFTVVAVSSGIFNADPKETTDACQQKSVFMNVRFYLPWIQAQMKKWNETSPVQKSAKSVLDENPAIARAN